VAFAYAGLSPDNGLVVSVLFGAASFIVGAFGGIVWIASGERLNTPPENAGL
jgi:glycosyltransferase 2 family protein